jgi:DNA-binding CsgD family transcriptional regulator
MSKQKDPNKLFDAIKNTQSIYYTDYVKDNISAEDMNIHGFSRNENSLKIIFDQVNYKMLHISDNLEALFGYTQAEFHQLNMPFVIALIPSEHITAPFVWTKWLYEISEKLNGPLIDYKSTICGVKGRHKDGHIMRLMIRYSALEMFDNGATKTAAVSIDDISHLYRGDFYWLHTTYGKEAKEVHHLLSTDEISHNSDIISAREKDALRLIAEGMDSKEIGKILFISPYTVDNHRRNMLARTGARDSTALVQICRMMGIL